MKVDFLLRFSTQFGQTLSISGNIPALGNHLLSDALKMEYLNEEFWHASIDLDGTPISSIRYYYIYQTDKGEVIKEAEQDRVISFEKKGPEEVHLVDTWNDAGAFENAFYTAPFKNVLLEKSNYPKIKRLNNYTHIFKVKAPLLHREECVCLIGDGDSLNRWSTEKPILLQKSEDWWTTRIDLKNAAFPCAYKYGVYNFKKDTFVQFEDGKNRILYVPASVDALTVIHDGFVHLPNNTWKGAGVAIPVFSLKSATSFGVGEFNDLKLLVDWAANAGLKLIQLLPVNDTWSTGTNEDSYPYASISAFALHPIYCNLQKVAGKKYSSHIKSLVKKQKQLNNLPHLDYEKVMYFKISALRELYQLQGNEFFEEKEYQDFFTANQHWLVPYAAFCYWRDRYKTADFSSWKTNAVYNEAEIKKISSRKSKCFKNIAFYYFLQYHLHLQLKEATAYAHKKGIVLKGDLPIGVARNSCDAWTAPQLFNLDQQAGAPPDDFAVRGQNWSFPTYNWQKMEETNFEWWQKRFLQMSYYFDAFRIDHILGFFRIWSIPLSAVEGIMGVFQPAMPVELQELSERGIWFDYDRYCKPFLTDDILYQLFGEQTEFVTETFLNKNSLGRYDFKEPFDTQRKVEDYFLQNGENENLKKGLFEALSNVVFFEQKDSGKRAYHFRISLEATSSFQQLDEGQKDKLKERYINYFYRRQDELWKKEGWRKLPFLKSSTDMLICGEDLGMVPDCVPEVMKRLGILSLEIQRMPKNAHTQFFHPAHAPYLSVITPSTHDMSTIRGWWEENRDTTQTFYNTVLEEQGQAPYYCDAWINRAIVLQHLYSPAMWSIFQLQDLLGMNDSLRRKNPQEERINQPADPKHYWKYRMHLYLEDLLQEKEFTNEIKDYIHHSGRNL